MSYVVHWKYKDGSLSGHGSPVPKEAAYAAVNAGNAEHDDIHHWVEENRTFSMFKVYDYKGGELSSSVNIILDQIVGKLLESMKGGYKAWDLPEAAMREFFANAEIETDLYAYRDSDNFCGEIYEHKDGKLIAVEPSYFLQFMADYIIKNLEED